MYGSRAPTAAPTMKLACGCGGLTRDSMKRTAWGHTVRSWRRCCRAERPPGSCFAGSTRHRTQQQRRRRRWLLRRSMSTAPVGDSAKNQPWCPGRQRCRPLQPTADGVRHPAATGAGSGGAAVTAVGRCCQTPKAVSMLAFAALRHSSIDSCGSPGMIPENS